MDNGEMDINIKGKNIMMKVNSFSKENMMNKIKNIKEKNMKKNMMEIS